MLTLTKELDVIALLAHNNGWLQTKGENKLFLAVKSKTTQRVYSLTVSPAIDGLWMISVDSGMYPSSSVQFARRFSTFLTLRNRELTGVLWRPEIRLGRTHQIVAGKVNRSNFISLVSLAVAEIDKLYSLIKPD